MSAIELYPKLNVLYVTRQVYDDYRQGKFTLRGLLEARGASGSLGISALVNKSGVRRDGSERYGSVIAYPDDPTFWDYKFQGTLEHIDRGIHPLYAYGSLLSPRFLEELKIFLGKAKQQNMHVVGFLPPYAPSVWNYMQKQDNHYIYIRSITPAIQHEFEMRGFSLFDFTDASVLNSPDEEFLDGNHGSEKTHARMILRMAEGDPVLGAYVDVARIRDALEKSRSNLEIF